MVGRDAELRILEDALRSASRGEGRAVAVAGDAGIGKTRLVEELAGPAERAGIPVLRGGCSETDLRIPYLPFIEALRTLGRRAAATLDGGLDVLFEPQEGDGSDPTRRRMGIFEAVVRSLEALAARRGAILIVEDLHWCDAASRDLLDYVVRSLAGSRLLVVCTYRHAELQPGHPLLPLVRDWVRRGLATQVELQPLDSEAIEAMLQVTIGPHDVGLAARLHRRCDGNPFVLEEILKVGGADLDDAALPATVLDSILRRLNDRGPFELEVLRAAAVLGDPLDDGVLAELLGDGVLDALESCARQQLMKVVGDRYAWRHALTREAMYQGMTPAVRRRLHARLAAVLDGRPGVDELTICGHLAAAGDWHAALPRCRQAAAAAQSVGAFADAARLLELCLPHVDEGSGLAEILAELPELLMQSGRPDAGERYARQALELRERQGDSAATADARRSLALCLWQQARWTEAIVLEDRAIAELGQVDPSPALVAALARRASWCILAEGDIPFALSTIEQARRLADECGFDATLYTADRGQVIGVSGRLDEGLGIMDDGWRTRLRPVGGRGTDWREGKFMLHHAVAFRNLLGRTNESLALLAEAPRSPAGQDAADTSLAVVRAEALWAHGEIASARQVLDSLELSRIERSVVPWAQSVRADVLAASGEAAAAAAIARIAMPPHWQLLSQLRTSGLIRVLVDADDLAAALELSKRLDRLASYPIELRLPMIDAAVEAHLAAGAVAEAAGIGAGAAKARPEDPYRLRVEARQLVASGDPDAAMQPLGQAIRGFAHLGNRQEEWRSRRLMTMILRRIGRRRDAQAEARRIEDEIAAANGSELLGLASARPPIVLSEREHEIALLVAQGLRNRDIAERLFISERTVENHIYRALERSGLRSRAQLAAAVTRLSSGLSASPR